MGWGCSIAAPDPLNEKMAGFRERCCDRTVPEVAIFFHPICLGSKVLKYKVCHTLFPQVSDCLLCCDILGHPIYCPVTSLEINYH